MRLGSGAWEQGYTKHWVHAIITAITYMCPNWDLSLRLKKERKRERERKMGLGESHHDETSK